MTGLLKHSDAEVVALSAAANIPPMPDVPPLPDVPPIPGGGGGPGGVTTPPPPLPGGLVPATPVQATLPVFPLVILPASTRINLLRFPLKLSADSARISSGFFHLM